MKSSRFKVILLGLAAMPLCYGAIASAATPNLGEVDSGRVSDMSKWYGRAGGLVGSDRVDGLRLGGRTPVSTALDQRVIATWDEGTAKRTHMPLAEEEPGAAEHPFRAPRKPHY